MPQLPSVFELINDPLHNKQDKTPPTPLPRISSSTSLSNPVDNTSPPLVKPRNPNRLSDSNIDYFNYYSPHRQSISSSIDSVSRKSSTNPSNIPTSIYRHDSIGHRHDSIGQLQHTSRQNSVSQGPSEAQGTMGGPKITNIPTINSMSAITPVQVSPLAYAGAQVSGSGSSGASQSVLGGPANDHFLSNRSASLPHAPVSYHGPDYYGSVQGTSQSGRQAYTGPNNQITSPPKGSLSYPTHNVPTGHHNSTQPEGYVNQQINFVHPMYNQNHSGPPGVPGGPNSSQPAYNGAYDYQMMPYSVQQPVYYPVYSQLPYNQVEENNALVNKRRIIKRRTRTGCLTCRKRRIKCDERKPYCFNCERSKKVCLGYENLSKLRKKSKPDSDSNSNDDDEKH